MNSENKENFYQLLKRKPSVCSTSLHFSKLITDVDLFFPETPVLHILGDPGAVSGGGKKAKRARKKKKEEKSRKKVGAPGILLLTYQFRNHLKSLPVIGHKNIFCAQSESSSFRVTFVTS